MLLRFPSLDYPDLVHAVTTRAGGVSHAPYDSLNLSWTRPDDPVAVLENRRRLCTALEIPLGGLVQAGQIHGIGVRSVGQAERGAGARERATVLPPADGIMTDEPEVYLLACFADCVPLLFFDPVRRVVGVAHAGWRGTVQGMAIAMISAMTARYGSVPQEVQVVIGPSAGPCCYAVGGEVVDAVHAAFPEHTELLIAGEAGLHFDLWAANRVGLLAAGVQDKAISVAGQCTIHQSERFFSHRATGGATGRIAAVIGLRDPKAEGFST